MKKFLFFVLMILCGAYYANAQTVPPGLIVNEFSQGHAGNQEYMEFVVVGNRTCTDSTLDLRGWIFDDQNGWYGAGNGLANGCVRFANVPNWQAVPYGSIILVYNNAQKDAGISLADDPTDVNHDYVYVLPITSNYIEGNGSTATITSYPTTGFTAGGGSWDYIVLNNSNDAVIVTSPANLSSAYHSVVYGFTPVGQTPTIVTSQTIGSNNNCYLNDNNYNSAASYIRGTVSAGAESPGAGNSAANIAWINSMRVQGPGGGPTTNIYDSICQGQDYTFNGTLYNVPGDYTASFPRPVGCDSTVILHLSYKNYMAVGNIGGTQPTICGGHDGTITFPGAVPGATYIVNYSKGIPPSAVAQPQLTLVANSAGVITIPNLSAGIYGGVTIDNGKGCGPTAFNGYYVVSDPNAPVPPTVSSNSPLCVSQTVSLSASSTTSGVTYKWTGPNGYTSNLANPTIPNATTADSGIYTVITSAATGCADTNTIYVRVSLILPVPTISSNTPVCLGDTLTLASVSAGTGVTYHWSGPNGFNTTTQNPVLANIPAAGAGTYSVFVSATAFCQSPAATTNVAVTVLPIPKIYADSPVCVGTTLHFSTDSLPGATYTWTLPNNTSLNQRSFQIPNVGASASGYYAVTIYINGCKSTGVTPPPGIQVIPIPPPPTASDIAYCQYTLSSPLTANGSSLRYYTTDTGGHPFPSTPVPSTYSVGNTTYFVSQVVQGCESPRVPLTVKVNELPNTNIVAYKAVLCQGDTLTLFHVPAATPGDTYTWILPYAGMLLTGNLASALPITAKFDSAGSQDVTLVASNGVCTDTGVYLVQVNANPNAGLMVKEDACPGESIGIGLDNRTDVSYYSVIYPGASLIKYDPALDVYYVKWNTAGTYIVTASLFSDVCPTSTVSDTVTVHGLPSAGIVAPSAGSTCIGVATPVSVQNPVNGYTYDWQPSRLFPTDSNQGILVTPVLEENTVLYLNATDAFGCIGTDSLAITSQPCCTISFPNAFTPNNDGHNDVFRPITTGSHKLNNFVVENRYGQVVYESRDEKSGWNGKFNGTDQPIGTYYYYIKFICASGKEVVQKGDVELVR